VASSSCGSRAQSAVMPSLSSPRAHRADVVVGALVAHDADGAHRQEHREGLPDGLVEARRADLLLDDGVGRAQDVEALGSTTGPSTRMARPGPGKGWRQRTCVGHAQRLAHGAHLVLEELAQRLDQA
jgi:hypothetical protein